MWAFVHVCVGACRQDRLRDHRTGIELALEASLPPSNSSSSSSSSDDSTDGKTHGVDFDTLAVRPNPCFNHSFSFTHSLTHSCIHSFFHACMHSTCLLSLGSHTPSLPCLLWHAHLNGVLCLSLQVVQNSSERLESYTDMLMHNSGCFCNVQL